MKFLFSPSGALRGFRCLLCGAILAAGAVRAGAVSQNTSDTGTISSFNTGAGWSGGLAPSSANDYLTSGPTLRTPSDALDHIFAGHSLTISGGGVLAFKGTVAGSTITVGTLNLTNGGEVSNFTGNSFTLAGNIILGSASTGRLGINSTSAGFVVSASISGDGTLEIANNASSLTFAVTLSGTNSYTGGTTVDASSHLIVGSASTLGTGNVTVAGSGQLELDSSQSIADTASLLLGAETSGMLKLAFTGTETVGTLSINGSYVAPGTYGAGDLGGAITGTGFLLVAAPEPSPALLGLAAGALGMAAGVVRRRAVRA